MKSVAFLFALGILISGCSSSKPPKAATTDTSLPTIVMPDNSLEAKVVSYNSAGRFVVLSFPISQMPRPEQILFLYRNGLKVGQVKITGPKRDSNIVADLVSGEAQTGDEVREQ
jgi:hypothetical protein